MVIFYSLDSIKFFSHMVLCLTLYERPYMSVLGVSILPLFSQLVFRIVSTVLHFLLSILFKKSPARFPFTWFSGVKEYA